MYLIDWPEPMKAVARCCTQKKPFLKPQQPSIWQIMAFDISSDNMFFLDMSTDMSFLIWSLICFFWYGFLDLLFCYGSWYEFWLELNVESWLWQQQSCMWQWGHCSRLCRFCKDLLFLMPSSALQWHIIKEHNSATSSIHEVITLRGLN